MSKNSVKSPELPMEKPEDLKNVIGDPKDFKDQNNDFFAYQALLNYVLDFPSHLMF